ncbi:MAG: hypothetical protein F2663_04270 [Actinobacteria bacterium]|nr:hypothetical protein [Actinomycetota bacterium]
MAVRIAFETIAVHGYPGRLQRVSAHTNVELARYQPIVSQTTSIVVFVFFAMPYMGNSVALYVGTVICFSPILLDRVAHRLPKHPGVAKLIPQGLAKWAYIIFSGIVAGKLLAHWVSDPTQSIRLGFLLLPLPLIAIAVLEYFVADDEDDEESSSRQTSVWMWRLTGTAVVVACVYVTVAGI